MDAGENDFLEAGDQQTVDLSANFFRRGTAAFAAGVWDDTVRAKGITAVLHFQISSGAPGEHFAGGKMAKRGGKPGIARGLERFFKAPRGV